MASHSHNSLFALIYRVVLCQSVFGQSLPYSLTTPYLLALEEREIQVCNTLKSYRDKLQTPLALIDEYLKDYEDSQSSQYSAQENPIQTTRMIRRFPKYIEPLKKRLNQGSIEKELNASLSTFSADVAYNFPTEYDYLEALETFLGLQYFYNLKPIEMLDGVLNGVPTGVGFDLQQSMELARYALQDKQFTLAYYWLQAIKEKHGDHNTEEVELLENQLFAEHDKIFETGVSPDEKYIFSSPISNRSKKAPMPLSRREEMLRKWENDWEWTHKLKNESETARYYSYLSHCSGKDRQTPKDKIHLKCWYSYDAFYILPLQVEQLHRDPDVLLYHKIIPDKWIQLIQQKSWSIFKEQNMRRTMERFFQGLEYTYFNDEDLKEIPLFTKIKKATGLKVTEEGWEHLRIVLYGNRGWFTIHNDGAHFIKHNNARVDFGRESVYSFLFYMSDVDLGGGTAFLKLGFNVTPEKGSAIFWSNFDANGDLDSKVIHVGCPSLLGRKWIAVQWIGLKGNGQGRFCHTHAQPDKLNSIAWDFTGDVNLNV